MWHLLLLREYILSLSHQSLPLSCELPHEHISVLIVKLSVLKKTTFFFNVNVKWINIPFSLLDSFPLDVFGTFILLLFQSPNPQTKKLHCLLVKMTYHIKLQNPADVPKTRSRQLEDYLRDEPATWYVLYIFNLVVPRELEQKILPSLARWCWSI